MGRPGAIKTFSSVLLTLCLAAPTFAASFRGLGDLPGEGDQVVGGLAHRRHDDHDVVAVALGDLHVLRHGPHAIGVGDRRAAVLLDDQRHGAASLQVAAWGRPGADQPAEAVTCWTTSNASRWAPVETGLPSADSALAWPWVKAALLTQFWNDSSLSQRV